MQSRSLLSTPAPTQVDAESIMADPTRTHLLKSWVFKDTVEQGKDKPHIYTSMMGQMRKMNLMHLLLRIWKWDQRELLSGQNSIYPDSIERIFGSRGGGL